jgi:hypothetical protein
LETIPPSRYRAEGIAICRYRGALYLPKSDYT